MTDCERCDHMSAIPISDPDFGEKLAHLIVACAGEVCLQLTGSVIVVSCCRDKQQGSGRRVVSMTPRFRIPQGTLVDFPKGGSVVVPKGVMARFSGERQAVNLHDDHKFKFDEKTGLRFETEALIQVEEALGPSGTVEVDGSPCTTIEVAYCTRIRIPAGTLLHVAEGTVRMEGVHGGTVEVNACSRMAWPSDKDFHIIQFDTVKLHIETVPAGVKYMAGATERFRNTLGRYHRAMTDELEGFTTEELKTIASEVPRLFRLPASKSPGEADREEILRNFHLE